MVRVIRVEVRDQCARVADQHRSAVAEPTQGFVRMLEVRGRRRRRGPRRGRGRSALRARAPIASRMRSASERPEAAAIRAIACFMSSGR